MANAKREAETAYKKAQQILQEIETRMTQRKVDIEARGPGKHTVTQEDLAGGLYGEGYEVGDEITQEGPPEEEVAHTARFEGVIHDPDLKESLEKAREELHKKANATVMMGESSLSRERQEQMKKCLQLLDEALDFIVDLNKHIAAVENKPVGLGRDITENEMEHDKFKLEQTSEAFKRFEAAFQKLDESRETRTFFQAMAHVWSKITHALKGMGMSASTRASEYGSSTHAKLSEVGQKIGSMFHSKSEGDGKKDDAKPSTPTPGGSGDGGDGK